MSFVRPRSLPYFFFTRVAVFGVASVVIVESANAQQGDTHVLSPIHVEGQQQSEKGDGPVIGYVARQSRAGTKTDTPIAITPQSVAVVPREQMQDQQVSSVAEALRYTPGVFTEYRGASNLRDEVFARGFYYVPRYLDGLFLGGDLSYAKIYPYLLERVEFLAGPSSVLYGQANPGGIINMVSKKPTLTPFREVELTAGSHKQMGLSFDFSDRIPGSETLFYRIVGTGFSRDLQEDFTKQRAIAIAPSVSWIPDAQTKLTVLGGYQNEPDAGFRNFLDAAGTIFPIAGYGYVPRTFFVSDPNYEKFKREQAWIGYEFQHAINDNFTVRQNVRYHNVDMEQKTLIWGFTTPNSSGANTIVHRNAAGGRDIWGQFTADNQLQSKFNTGWAEHTVLTGVDYKYSTRDYQWGNASVPNIDLTKPQYGGFNYGSVVLNPYDVQDLVAKQAGIYAQDQIKIGRLNLTAGIRHDWASTDIDDKLGTNDQSYNHHAFTWRVGALYAFDNGLAPYASYSTSFEPALYLPPVGQAGFVPTTAEQFEAGVKFAPVGTNALLTAAYYDLTQRNVVMGLWTPGIGNVYSQIGEIHNHGIELSARAEITANLSFIASYALTRSEIVESVTVGEVGKTPARVPEHQAALWGKYSFASGPLNSLTLGSGARYIGRSWGDNINTFEVPEAILFDAMVKYDFGVLAPSLRGVALQVNVKNLADKTYVASCASLYACFYGEGRVVTASLKYNW